MEYRLQTPLTKTDAAKLRAGDTVLLSGTVYTARDAAHKRLCALADAGEALPVDVRGAVIYYAGPTTSGRMDAYAPALLRMDLAGMIGKGARSEAVVAAMRESGAVYFAAIGGAGALIASCVERAELICWPELGSEAVRRLTVRELPLIVAIDSTGADLYKTGPAAYRKAAQG